MDRLQLKAEPRSVLGKKVRALRRQGILPANVYGHQPSQAVQVPARETERILSLAGKTRLISLGIDGGEPTTVLVKDIQRHPVKGTLLHVDFYRVAMSERLRVDVPLRLVGEAPGLRQFDATLLQPISTITVESLPGNLPEAIEVDLSSLVDLDSAIYVRDLSPPDDVTIVTDPEELVAKLLPPTVAEAVPEEEVAGAEAAGPEAAPAAERSE